MQYHHVATRVVLKFGTENLFGNSALLTQSVFSEYVSQIIPLLRERKEVIIVSSGAIAAGAQRVAALGREQDEFTKKELASIGTRHLLALWGRSLSPYGVDIAPVLVTYANWEDPRELASIRRNISGCAQKGMVPLVNENDVVSDEEVRLMERGISENDRLARMVAELASADAVLFLTNVSHVFEVDPRVDPKARRFAEVDHTRILEHEICNGTSVSKNGRGGIASKVREAVLCKRALPSAHVAIAGNEKDIISRFVRGEHVGTRIGTRTSFHL